MKHRSPVAVFLLPIITLGIYSLVWSVKTKNEMNTLGQKIPTAWILLIPIVGGFWFYWEYAKGVEHITEQKLNWIIAFMLLLFLHNVGAAIIQDYFNKLSLATPASTPLANQPMSTAPIAPEVQSSPPAPVVAAETPAIIS